MKFSVERATLYEAVTKLQKVVGLKTSMPVLEGILISAEQGKITMAAYNLEMGMKKEMYAHTEEEGDIVINARLLGDILRSFKGALVEIEADEKQMCHIRSEESVFDIVGMAAVDFPEMPSVADGKKVSISGEVLADMVKGTGFAVAQIEGSRPILTGIDVSVKENTIQFVSIDGYRLAIRRQKTDIADDLEFVVSGRAISEAVKLITDQKQPVEITVGDRLISFSIEDYVFISRLLEGEFVDYAKIIPDSYTQRINIDCADFTNSIERVSLLINNSNNIPIRCNFKEEALYLSCASEMGRVNEKIDVALEGAEFEIGLNSKYLLDALHASDDGEISIKFNGPNAGVLIEAADDANKDFLYLLMPMRLK